LLVGSVGLSAFEVVGCEFDDGGRYGGVEKFLVQFMDVDGVEGLAEV